MPSLDLNFAAGKIPAAVNGLEAGEFNNVNAFSLSYTRQSFHDGRKIHYYPRVLLLF